MQDVKIQDVETTVLAVPAGITNAVIVDNIARQGDLVLRMYTASATLQIMGATYGATYSAAQLNNFAFGGSSQMAYLFLSADAPFRFNGPTRFYLGATSATLVVGIMKGRVSQT